LRPGNMTAVKMLAEACIADPAQAHIDAFEFPIDPDNPCDFTTPENLDRQKGFAEYPVLTPGQTALAMAALHEAHCQGVERVISISTDVRLADDFQTTGHLEVADNYHGFVRWKAIRDHVKMLGEYSLFWFKLQLRRFELIFAEFPVTEPQATPAPKPGGKRGHPAMVDAAIGVLRKHPEWTDTRIAEAVGCTAANLSGNDGYKAVRKAIKDAGKKDRHRSSRDRGREMDQYASDE